MSLLPWEPGYMRDSAQKKKSNHVRVHANLIEGFWELALALPRDNPWRNDLRHLVHAGQEGIRWYPHFLPFGLPVGEPRGSTT